MFTERPRKKIHVQFSLRVRPVTHVKKDSQCTLQCLRSHITHTQLYSIPQSVSHAITHPQTTPIHTTTPSLFSHYDASTFNDKFHFSTLPQTKLPHIHTFTDKIPPYTHTHQHLIPLTHAQTTYTQNKHRMSTLPSPTQLTHWLTQCISNGE